MPRVFFGNLDFEHELAAPAGQAHPLAIGKTPKPRGADLAWAWTAIAEAEEVILTDGDFTAVDFDELARLGLPIPRFLSLASPPNESPPGTLIPWGWTSSVLNLGRARGWNCFAPPIEVVREVNTRAFRFALEEQWEIALPGAVLITSLEQSEKSIAAVGDWERGWLLKANFGMSGREALRGRGTVLDDATRNWALKRLRATGGIVVEPIVERIVEAGVQIEIPQAGEPELLGITPLLVDRAGVYRGSRFGSPASEVELWQPAAATALSVARAIQRLGYFGPLGIDAMQYRDRAGQIRMRPLQDLNARYTMGRLALGFRRVLPTGWCGSWLHFGAKQLGGRDVRTWLADALAHCSNDSRVAIASPREISLQPAQRHAVLVLSPTVEARTGIEHVLFASLGINVDCQ